MEMIAQTVSIRSKRALWTSRILKGLVVLFLILDGAMHLATPPPVVEAMNQLGFPLRVTVGIAVIELICTALYIIPATSVLGAILLTGYIGGAVAAHVRVGNPIFESYIFPALVGTLIWGAILVTDERLRALIPLRRTTSPDPTRVG